jgi:hypothetical protein
MTDLYESIQHYAKTDPAFANEVDPDGCLLDQGNRDGAFDWKTLCSNYLASCEVDDPCAQIAALNAILEAAAAFDCHVLH